MFNAKILLPWQETSLLCHMFATCIYPEQCLVQDSESYIYIAELLPIFGSKTVTLLP